MAQYQGPVTNRRSQLARPFPLEGEAGSAMGWAAPSATTDGLGRD